MIIYVDIDDTICTYEGERNYPDAIPLKENIDKINQLYEDGHEIIYWTARGGTTGIDWTELTNQQLKNWNVKCHEIRMSSAMRLECGSQTTICLYATRP